MQQEKLWHDTLADALRDVVLAAGGPKAVAYQLWPTKDISAAARLLNHCLDDERAEKLALEELVAMLRMGREAGCHVAMHFLAESSGYEKPRTVDPETEREKVEREFIKARDDMAKMLNKLERLGAPA